MRPDSRSGSGAWSRRPTRSSSPAASRGNACVELGAPLPWERVEVVPPPIYEAPAAARHAAPAAPYALVVSRLSPEKGVDVAIDACGRAGIDLRIAGDGPERAGLERMAAGARSKVTLLGRVSDEALAQLRQGASIALAPSRSAETFGLALAEAMLAGVPAAGTRVGALPELLDSHELAEPGDARALAQLIERAAGDRAAGEAGRRRVRELCSPAAVAARLAEVYGP